MSGKLKQAEYLAETIAHKADQLIAESERLREELSRVREVMLRTDKAFVEAWRKDVQGRGVFQSWVLKLEHFLRKGRDE